jgi:hypothetical protein
LWDGIRETNDGGGVGPRGGEQDGFIAWVENRADRERDGLNAGCGDDDVLAGIDFDALKV